MIAYLILVHRYPDQFKRLFHAIYHPNNHYVIHVDKTSGKEISDEITLFLNDYQNAEILESENALWGGYIPNQLEDAGLRT
ncbi:beta-1,6-N-acetylglucosaminyltransferase [Vibrio anguillarum]|uniref:beta-1,6-N-acetylglucosaminyltransferase n=1 Tax=Vibrio anguillarum TaxID=55601 RepID=UPI003593A54E